LLLADAEKLALELMAQFGLMPNWRFEFDDAVRRFGCCHRHNTRRYMGGRFAQLSDGGKITLSRELVSRNDREQVEDTIRHEIAHALCPPRCGHGPEWKAMCARTGANPERCYDHTEVDAPQGDWTATCGGCGRVHHKFRQPKRELYCAAKDCRKQNPPEYGQGRFNPICKLVWRHKNALPEAGITLEQRRAGIEFMKAQLRAQQEKK
jgi:predicted SprT family Zn-dependent metalloprotease